MILLIPCQLTKDKRLGRVKKACFLEWTDAMGGNNGREKRGIRVSVGIILISSDVIRVFIE